MARKMVKHELMLFKKKKVCACFGPLITNRPLVPHACYIITYEA